MYHSKRTVFCMFTILALWGMGSYIVVFDLASVPKVSDDPEWYAGKKTYQDPDRVWEWNIGNGFVSNIENIVMWLCEFFGFLRFLDLIKLFHEDEKIYRWRMFWELCEQY